MDLSQNPVSSQLSQTTNQPETATTNRARIIWLLIVFGIINAGVCWLFEEAIIRYVFPFIMSSDFYFMSGLTPLFYYGPGLIEIILVALYLSKRINLNKFLVIGVFIVFRVILMYSITYSYEIKTSTINTVTQHKVEQPTPGEVQLADELVFFQTHDSGYTTETYYSLNVKTLEKKIVEKDKAINLSNNHWDENSMDGNFKIKEVEVPTRSVPVYSLISNDGKKEIAFPENSYPEIWLTKSNAIILDQYNSDNVDTTNIVVLDINGNYKVLDSIQGSASFWQ